MLYPRNELWAALTQAERDRWIEAESAAIIHQLTMIEAGLAVRRAGLIYFLPLCHDAYGEGNA